VPVSKRLHQLAASIDRLEAKQSSAAPKDWIASSLRSSQ
jgi:hypothetical protein